MQAKIEGTEAARQCDGKGGKGGEGGAIGEGGEDEGEGDAMPQVSATLSMAVLPV